MEQTSAGGRALTVGSLFDGSGGFPLGAERLGMHPLWASEIEPFPIAVTRRRFPNMEHLGDVSLIKGAEIPPVDIITFGSPCQGLSLAGRREGLADVRSNLFYQALRVVREMREATDGEHPRFIVWENVFGALSSNCGQDFRAVLQEVTDAKYEGVHVPQPQRWSQVDSSWRMVTLSHGESSMPNTGESPRNAEESSLSQILLEDVPSSYCLSPRACKGILRRCEERGKELPKELKEALEANC